MATSDNVVRAGLTPKHRDVQTLCKMLTYRTFAGTAALLTLPRNVAPGFWLYESPVPEFSVLKVEKEARAVPLQVGHSIFLCLSGSATLLPTDLSVQAGSIIYLPPKTTYSLSNVSSDFSAYQAFEPLVSG
jgi:mannose-6-phosphate isomerase